MSQYANLMSILPSSYTKISISAYVFRLDFLLPQTNIVLKKSLEVEINTKFTFNNKIWFMTFNFYNLFYLMDLVLSSRVVAAYLQILTLQAAPLAFQLKISIPINFLIVILTYKIIIINCWVIGCNFAFINNFSELGCICINRPGLLMKKIHV